MGENSRYIRLVGKVAFKKHEWGRDFLVAAGMNLTTLLVSAYWGLITKDDWSRHRLFFILAIVAPYAIVFLPHIGWKLFKAAVSIHSDDSKGIESLTSERDAAIDKDRPEVFASLEFGPNHRYNDGSAWVTVHNRGKRVARVVQISPILLIDRTIHFADISFLEPDQRVPPDFKYSELLDWGEPQRWDVYIYILRHVFEKRLTAMKNGEIPLIPEDVQTLRFPIHVSWEDSNGNRFSSTGEITYEYFIQKCRTRPGTVVRHKSTRPQ